MKLLSKFEMVSRDPQMSLPLNNHLRDCCNFHFVKPAVLTL